MFIIFLGISRKDISKKKKETNIYGIPDDIDCQLLKKVWNKIYNCACTVKKDPKTNEEYLTLRGDHRKEIFDFLIEEKLKKKKKKK